MGKTIILNTWIIISFILAISVIFLTIKIIIAVIRDKEMKWFNRLKWHLKEIDKTFSNQPSHYSSKRIERWILFISANVSLQIGFFYLLYNDKINPAEAVMIYAAQMVYAGFQTKQISKDVNSSPKDNSNSNEQIAN